MVDLEVRPPAHRGEQRCDDGLGEILDPLAAGAHQVVVVLGVAGEVRRGMALALEAAGHPVLHLGLEGAVHRGPPERRVGGLDPDIELLRRQGPPRRRERLGHDDPLARETAPAGGEAVGDLGGLHALEDTADRAAQLTLGLIFNMLRPNLI